MISKFNTDGTFLIFTFPVLMMYIMKTFEYKYKDVSIHLNSSYEINLTLFFNAIL